MIDTETLFYKFKIYTELGENAAVHLPLSVALECCDAIKERDAKISQLEKEADWLADVLGKSDCPKNPTKCDILKSGKMSYEDCTKCWREVARMATHDK